jgi:hypothetical protein
MRYKNNILEKLSKFEITISKLVIQTNRNESQDTVLESLNGLKEEVEEMRGMISNEPDDFEQQFRG